jgi:hypothetical protein
LRFSWSFARRIFGFHSNISENSLLERLLGEYGALFENAAKRLQVSHVSWREVRDAAKAIVEAENGADAGSETHKRLMQGFVEAIDGHSGTSNSAA